jgi:hypothetical protein
MSPIYQNEWASIARMLIALQRDLRTTLFPREVGVVDSFMLEALLLRLYLWQLEGTPVTVSMLSRSLGVSIRPREFARHSRGLRRRWRVSVAGFPCFKEAFVER